MPKFTGTYDKDNMSFRLQRREVRPVHTDFTVREEEDARIIEGYFSVFNSIYERQA